MLNQMNEVASPQNHICQKCPINNTNRVESILDSHRWQTNYRVLLSNSIASILQLTNGFGSSRDINPID